MIEMVVDSIRVSPTNYQRVVVLKEKDGDRYLPIWIGPAEADAIAVKLQDLSVPRPLTHDLLRTVVDTLGGSVKHILVSDLQNDTFYAKIVIQAAADGAKEIDCRPSDAVALAVRVEAPIFAEEAVLEKVGILIDKETGKPITDEAQGNEPSSEAKPPAEEKPEGPSAPAFETFLTEEGGDLHLEEFGKEGNPPGPS